MLSQAFRRAQSWLLIFVGLWTPSLLAQTLDLLSEKKVWSGDTLVGGPWEAKEWGAFGSPSLKADVELKAGAFYVLKVSQDRDLSHFDWISALVTRSWWGDFGDVLHARIYVKTGSQWEWHEGPTVPVAPSFSQFYYAHNTVLDFDLRQIPERSKVREIGVQFVSGANASGRAAVYLGQFRLTAQNKFQAFPQWVRPQTSVPDGFGRYFTVESQRLVAIDLKNGSSKWTQSFPGPIKAYFPETNRNEAAYVVGPDKIQAINRDSGSILWTRSFDRQSYVEINTDTEQGLYLTLYTNDRKNLIAVRKSDGATLWEAKDIDYSSPADEHHAKLYAYQGVVAVVRKGAEAGDYAVTGIEKSSGNVLWTYSGEAEFGLRLHPTKSGELLIAGGSEVISSVSALEVSSGRPLWTYYNDKRIDVAAVDAKVLVLLRVGDSLVALDKQSGQVSWEYAAAGYFTFNLDGQGRAYLGTWNPDGDALIALDAKGRVRWRHTAKNGSVSFVNGFIQAVERAGTQSRISFLDLESGRPKWEYSAKTDAALVWTNSRDYIIIDGSQFHAFDPASGAALWTFMTARSATIMQGDDANVYLQEYDADSKTAPMLLAVNRATGQLVWKYQPVSGLAGLNMGASSSSNHQGLVFFQYVVGSKFPITQGTLALPLR